MTDSTAPERIHLKFGRTEALGPTIRMWQASPFEGGAEYVRADLAGAEKEVNQHLHQETKGETPAPMSGGI